MKGKMVLSTLLVSVLALSLVAAAGFSTSIRGSGGDIIQINGVAVDSGEKVSFSAYVSEGSARAGQGSVILSGSGESIRVKLTDAVILTNNANVLKVESVGYYYERTKNFFGFYTLQKVEGKVLYTLNKNTLQTDIVGSNGLNFKVNDVETRILR